MLKSQSRVSGIYLLQNIINNKVYIGKSVNIYKRRSAHKRSAENPAKISVIAQAIRKYGWENFKFSIIELTGNMPEKEVLFRESLWIKYYRSLVNQHGYNVCPYSRYDELKIGNRKRGKDCYNYGIPRSEEVKRKISQTMLKEIPKGEKHHMFGRKQSIETINKKKEWTPSPEQTAKRVASLKKPIKQLDLNGNFIRFWDSATDAAICLWGNKNSKSPIFAALHGRQESSLGFKWEFVK